MLEIGDDKRPVLRLGFLATIEMDRLHEYFNHVDEYVYDCKGKRSADECVQRNFVAVLKCREPVLLERADERPRYDVCESEAVFEEVSQ